MQEFTIPEALHPMLSSDDSGGDSTLTPSGRLPVSACYFGGKPLLDALPKTAGIAYIRS